VTKALLTKFYNVRVGRDQGQVAKELRALLDSGPHILGLCEATGYDLPDVDGYAKVRDRSTKSRANVAAYVKKGQKGDHWWHDCRETWGRTQKPGEHEARSWIEVTVGTCQFLIGHQPPKGTDNVHDSQDEGIDLCADQMQPWKRDGWEGDKENAKAKPRIALCDWNRQEHEDGPGPKALRERIDGKSAMDHIDGAVFRGGDVSLAWFDYKNKVAGVTLKTDHPWGAFVAEFTVKDRWLG
jgi:hypothetical protein